MKILIAEKSFQIRKRIIKLLSCIKGIETISISGTYKELVKHLSLSAFEIVIADISVFGASVFKDINTVKDEYMVKKLIVLMDFYSSRIQETKKFACYSDYSNQSCCFKMNCYAIGVSI